MKFTFTFQWMNRITCLKQRVNGEIVGEISKVNVMQSLCEWRLVMRLFWVCHALEWPRNVRENQRYTCGNVQNIDDTTSALAAAVAAVHGGEHSTERIYTACCLCVLICLVAFERDWKSCFRMHLQSVQSHLLVALQTHADTSWFEQLPKWETICTCKHSKFPLRSVFLPFSSYNSWLSRQSEIERIQWANEVWATAIHSYLIVLTDFKKLL